MSLITRCPACGTMFKVVTDQLKVSSGWVRCGQCAEVFDASANLQHPAMASSGTDAGDASAAPVSASLALSAPTDAASINAASGAVDDALTGTDIPSPSLTLREPEAAWTPGASFADPVRFQPGTTASDDSNPSADTDSSFSDFDPMGWKRKMLSAAAGEHSSNPGAAAPSASAATAAMIQSPGDRSDDADADADADVDAPGSVSFVQEARRKVFWRTRGMRALLGFSGLLLAVLLLIQIALQQRDILAAREPRLKPWLQALCRPLQCELAPLRQIDILVIDSSTFRRVGPDAYRLGFSIKNPSDLSVAMPSLEVTLTDTQEQPVVRRVISPAQFGATQSLLAANSSFAGMVAFEVAVDRVPDAALALPDAVAAVGPLRVAGYRMLAFYP